MHAIAGFLTFKPEHRDEVIAGLTDIMDAAARMPATSNTGGPKHSASRTRSASSSAGRPKSC